MKKRLNIYIALSGIIGIALSVFMVYCFLHHAEIDGSYTATGRVLVYFENSGMVTAFTWSCILSLLMVILLSAFTIKECDLVAVSKNNVCVVFSTSLLGFLFAGYVVNFLITPFRGYWSTVEMPGADLSAAAPLLRIIYYAGIVVAIPCAIYFLMMAIQNEFKPSSKFAFLSVCPVIWLALRLVFYFMSTSAHVNLAGRSLYIVSVCIAIVFFLQDAKRWLSREDKTDNKEIRKHSALYFASGFATIVSFLAYHPAITYLQAFWMLNPEDSYLLNGIFIAMILYVAFRIGACFTKSF